MSGLIQRLASKALEQIAGSGVGLDDDGRLCLPDGLDPPHAHRFIEHVLDRRFPHPKAALHALFGCVGVDPRAVEVLDHILTDEGAIDWAGVGHESLALARHVSRLREIPLRIHEFLTDGLGIADASAETLEEAVVSTRKNSARALGCEASWSALLADEDGIRDLSRAWREGLAASA